MRTTTFIGALAAGAPVLGACGTTSATPSTTTTSPATTVATTPAPATTAPSHNGVTLRALCLDADAFSKDVLTAEKTSSAPASMGKDAAALATAAKGYGPPFLAEVRVESAALKAYATTQNIAPIDNELTKILAQCTAKGI
jgi:hypothetical protein